MSETKILVVGPCLDCRGGISAVSRMLDEYLKGEGYPIDHLSSTIEGPFVKRQLYTLISYLRFLKILFHRRHGLIHIHSSTNNSFYRKIYYIVLSKFARRKIVLHVHPGRFLDFYRSKARFLRYLLKKVLAMPDAIIVLSAGFKERFRMILPEKNIFVLNNPVNSADFRCRYDKTEKIILYLGWFIPEKGVFDVVKAIPDVIAQEPSAEFVFYGIKEIEKLRSLFVGTDYQNQVSVNEWVSGEEKKEILARSAMLLLPSYTEGFPNVILEAMASCLPIVTTRVGAIPELLEEGKNCLYFQPGDVRTLSEKILQLLKNPELRLRLGKANLELAREKYDIKVIGGKLEEIYSIVDGEAHEIGDIK